MAKLAYLECPTGIAGDMCLGAIVDAGVPLSYLTEQLARLGLAHEYQLEAKQVHRNGQQATKVNVYLHPAESDAHSHTADSQTAFHHNHSSNTAPAHAHPAPHALTPSSTRHLPEIERLITTAQLSPRATAWSLKVFQQLAQAEGAVHGIPPTQVHFHEVGAIDAIVDIVGTCLGLDWLDIDQLYCSALPTGGGTIRAAHGLLPVPAPAVLKLWELRQVPIYSNGIQRELVTPTGAAIVTTLVTRFGEPPAMTLQKVGLGAGSRDLAIPNLLRLWLGEGESHSSSVEAVQQPHPASSPEPIALLETQIDDSSPQAIGYLYEALFAAGAVDVFTQAIGMKKSRLGILLSVVCHPQQVKACEAVLFRETTTLGIRHSLQTRSILQRRFETVVTAYGAIQIKIARLTAEGAIVNVQPEYEDCAAVARQTGQPWREIHRLALQQWYEHHASDAAGAIEYPS